MTDIFHEVQEDLRRERLQRLWTRYGWLIVAVAVLLVAAAGGWRGYEYWQARQAEAAGDRYQAAARLAEEGKADEAKAAFAELAANAPAGYQALARLREAAEVVKSDPAAALKLYEAVANDSAADALLRDAARVRAGYVAVDHASRDEVRKLVEALAVDNGPWRQAAREVLGLAAYKAGDLVDARRQFEALVSDPETGQGARQRADLMLSVMPAAAAAPAK
ncbi:tetratricopeptide repeat protein [Methylopila turkensis]|uniref:Ancillary SecYEG translocon subunit/Cell division coordinator CpoB TPR domain-containing protein n=1 Tax=Methylopila turkensis TaxID=1437816 RepID=A0A9W6JPP6_9HYPH|nr:tetratricopeptide repeat protein [Methylopila turkensis]GLK80024.1 hypothetical protein GCM10008174_17650 [Methylopila turkensis]